MIQRRRSRLKPVRIIRRRTGYPGLRESSAYGIPPSNALSNDSASRFGFVGQINSQCTALWAGSWPR